MQLAGAVEEGLAAPAPAAGAVEEGLAAPAPAAVVVVKRLSSDGGGAAHTSRLLDLPDACLLRVLQCLAAAGRGNHRRLFSAARAHSRLHATAAEALSALQVTVDSQQRADGALAYLAGGRRHITSVDCRGNGSAAVSVLIKQLPDECSQLRSLRLSGFKLQLAPLEGGSPGVLHALSSGGNGQQQLTRLEASGSLLDSSPAGVADALARLPGLRRLELETFPPASWWHQPSGHRGLPCHVWQALSASLTALTLSGRLVPDAAAVEGLSCLSQLRELRLTVSTVGPTVTVGLHSLTRLVLNHATLLDPAALACISQLQCLELIAAVAPEGTAALLAQLGALSGLTRLKLSGMLSAEVPAPAFSALTANSTTLRQLELSACSLPAGVWAHVFDARRPCTALQVLRVVSTRGGGDGPAPLCITTLAACCPALRELQLSTLAPPPTQALQCLSALAQLTRLVVTSAAGAAALQACTELPLRHLSVRRSSGVERAHLVQLAFCQQLQYVRWGFVREASTLELKRVQGGPSLWAQLQERLREQNDADSRQAQM